MKTGIIIAMTALVLLSSIGVVMAHGIGEDNDNMFEQMDNMHDTMTANSEVRDQMDQMHEVCQSNMV